MERKVKYSKKLKLEIAKRYLKGESARALANKYGLGGTRGGKRIHKWAHRYEVLGEGG